MTLTVFLAVMAAALMHAVWNAMVKIHADRFVSVTLLTLGTAVTVLPIAPFVDIPGPSVWPWIMASVVFHMGYKLFLIRAYEAGDLAQTYPLARGTAPLLTTLGAMIIASEFPSGLSLGGIVLLSAGTFLMSFRGAAHLEKLNGRAVFYALITSVFIACYTLSDGSGARLASSASSYAVYLFLSDGLWSLILALALRGKAVARTIAAGWRAGLLTGALSGAAYWIAMWAMTQAPIASVASLRETSILFAMVISVLALGERLTAWRIAAALLIVTGVVALRLG